MNDAVKYWVGFSRVAGIGSARLRLLQDHFGSVQQAWEATDAELQASGLPHKALRSLINTRKTIDLDVEMSRLDQSGFQALTWDDEEYPELVRETHDPPPVLYLWGELHPSDRWAVAMVGTRRASPYGRGMAVDIARGLASNGITVVSGMARGIDGLSHRAALAAGGRTLAVLGSGLDHI